jgi:hypothetical protein
MNFTLCADEAFAAEPVRLRGPTPAQVFDVYGQHALDELRIVDDEDAPAAKPEQDEIPPVCELADDLHRLAEKAAKVTSADASALCPDLPHSRWRLLGCVYLRLL